MDISKRRTCITLAIVGGVVAVVLLAAHDSGENSDSEIRTEANSSDQSPEGSLLAPQDKVERESVEDTVAQETQARHNPLDDVFFPYGNDEEELKRMLGKDLSAFIEEGLVRRFLLSWSHDDPLDGSVPYAQLGIEFGDTMDPVMLELEGRILKMNDQLESMVKPIMELAGDSTQHFAKAQNIVASQQEAQEIARLAVKEGGSQFRPLMLITELQVGQGFIPFGFNSSDFPILNEAVEEANRIRRERMRIIDTMRSLMPADEVKPDLGTGKATQD